MTLRAPGTHRLARLPVAARRGEWGATGGGGRLGGRVAAGERGKRGHAGLVRLWSLTGRRARRIGRRLVRGGRRRGRGWLASGEGFRGGARRTGGGRRRGLR